MYDSSAEMWSGLCATAFCGANYNRTESKNLFYEPYRYAYTLLLPISATIMNNTALATSPWVISGMYTAKLTVNGKIHTHIFEVKMDPRV